MTRISSRYTTSTMNKGSPWSPDTDQQFQHCMHEYLIFYCPEAYFLRR
jgi:hypothetical protein